MIPCTSGCWKEKICPIVTWKNCHQYKDIDYTLANVMMKSLWEFDKILTQMGKWSLYCFNVLLFAFIKIAIAPVILKH